VLTGLKPVTANLLTFAVVTLLLMKRR